MMTSSSHPFEVKTLFCIKFTPFDNSTIAHGKTRKGYQIMDPRDAFWSRNMQSTEESPVWNAFKAPHTSIFTNSNTALHTPTICGKHFEELIQVARSTLDLWHYSSLGSIIFQLFTRNFYSQFFTIIL